MSRKLPALIGWLLLVSPLRPQAPPLRVPPDIQQERLIRRVRPLYPKLARDARIQGTVRLLALIGEDGVVDRLKLISGHPLLVGAALDAAKQWRYRPAIRNGLAAPVITTIEITFSLGGSAPEPSQPGRTLRA